MITDINVCQCGRAYTHCSFCGSKNLSPLKIRSLSRTAEIGRMVTVWRCKKCGNETDNALQCNAPTERIATDYVPFKKPEQQQPWGLAIPGTTAHYNLLCQWVVENQEKHKWDRIRVYVEAQIAGWHLEAYPEMDEDVKRALIEKGLLTGAGVDTAQARQQSGGSDVATSPADSIAEAPVPLEDIIEAMGKEQQEGRK